jgi:hypothetical protein
MGGDRCQVENWPRPRGAGPRTREAQADWQGAPVRIHLSSPLQTTQTRHALPLPGPLCEWRVSRPPTHPPSALSLCHPGSCVTPCRGDTAAGTHRPLPLCVARSRSPRRSLSSASASRRRSHSMGTTPPPARLDPPSPIVRSPALLASLQHLDRDVLENMESPPSRGQDLAGHSSVPPVQSF